MSTLGMSALSSAGSLVGSLGPRSAVLANQIRMLGSTLSNSFGSGLGSAQVTAGMGRTASLGTLSVPQSWAAAAPEFSRVGSTLPAATAGVSAAPAVRAGQHAQRDANATKRDARYGCSHHFYAQVRLPPTAVQTPVYAG